MPYDSQNQHHEELLMNIWMRLRPDRKLEARKTAQSVEIGFQGKDPATDFRGAGFLGLFNLYSWVSKSEGRNAFSIA